MLPTFLIIGAMKSGTSSLYNYLKKHPEVFMARAKASTKTIHYFCERRNLHKGRDWYESLFETDSPERYKAYGEASGSYSKYPGFKNVPEQIHALVPDIKLIYIVRDPVERTISHHSHLVLTGRIESSLAETLKDFDIGIVNTSRYFMQIEHYLPYFSRDQFHIVCSEEMRDNRKATLQDVFRFIGVDDSFYTRDYDKVHHSTETKARKLKTRPKRNMPELTGDFVQETLDPELKQRLIAYFRPDVQALKAFSGQSFSKWQF